MSKSKVNYNVNSSDTDFVNLGTIKLNLNDLQLARVVIDGATSYGILFMKAGNSYVVDTTVINNLDDYCR